MVTFHAGSVLRDSASLTAKACTSLVTAEKISNSLTYYTRADSQSQLVRVFGVVVLNYDPDFIFSGATVVDG